MSTDALRVAAGHKLSLAEIEHELSSLLESLQQPGEGPVQRSRMSNLMIYCDKPALAEGISAAVPAVVASHPTRVLLLVADANGPDDTLVSSATAWCQSRGSQKTCFEKVTLQAGGRAVDRLPYVVRGLLVGDLPTNLWWASTQPPALTGSLLYELAETAQQVIYDSIGWPDPARGVAATASWLERFERAAGPGFWRVASDLNWRRLKFWRRLMGQALDPATAPGALDSITEIQVEHGPHAVVQAWELVSFLAFRLGWKVKAGRVQPNVEIAWQATAPHGQLRIRIRRLAEGPSEIRRIRIACALDGKPGALLFAAEDSGRLSVTPEGIDAAPRTMAVPPQPLADLVGRQLADRERDPVFRESMAVAQVMAQSVLG
jgi:glucose-6-phosphate dehydrogenase assembly protein OpcA